MALRFDDKVVLITGAGQGLGRSHALLFASLGAKVVVNDLGGSAFGDGSSSSAADTVVAEIKASGGEAVANYDSVEDGEKLVQTALDNYGRIDVIVNNAGILRDKSFAKLTDDDWDIIYRVHVRGAYKVVHTAWPHMREQRYGRIIMTASAAGIYGNFGQANYAMAKLGLTGFANTLALEGARRGIHVNTIAPIAGSRLTETILPPELIDALKPEYVSPLVAYLSHESCEENGGLFEVGGGFVTKLRWERTKGTMWRVGRRFSIDDVASRWSTITDFSETEHPATVTDSMMTIMDNIKAGPSRGGNQYVDVDQALGYEYPETTSTYDERDLALYALGVGAAHNPLDDADLKVVYELHSGGFRALPTYGAVPVINAIIDLAKQGKMAPGLNFGFDRLLHGEQYTKLERPLPPNQTLTHKSRIKDIWDKGKGAVIVTETTSFDEDGDLIVTNEFTAFIRGAGGWGGERGPSSKESPIPERDADAVISEAIPQNQALLYRLSGDINPLHADPSFAKVLGFDRPILHGMCTYGYAARHIIAHCGGDPRLFKSIRVRFAQTVNPGETLETRIWNLSETEVAFECRVVERDVIVLSGGTADFYREIPKKAAKVKAAPAQAAAPVSAEPTSGDVFEAISRYISGNPAAVEKAKTVYCFKLKNPGSAWTVDLKNGAGSVASGDTGGAECTLEIEDSTFMAMCRGEADPQKLFFSGDLKISGNVMASQKLTFLSKIDPNVVLSIAKARVGAGGGSGAAATANAAPEPTLTSAVVFRAIGAWLGKNPAVSERVGMTFHWKLSDPSSTWSMILKDGGSVERGEAGTADTTLSLSDANFMAMVDGKADPQKMFFSGDLKVSGNVMAAQKLDFLTKIDPAEIEAAMAEMPTGSDEGAAPEDAPAEAFAPTFFGNLAATVAGDFSGQILFRIAGQGEWTVTIADGQAKASDTASEPNATLSLSDEDLAALAAGSESAYNLYQRGQLRVDGDIRAAHHLSFISHGAA